MRATLSILLAVLAVLAVAGLAYVMVNDPADAPAPVVREIAPGVRSTEPAPWSQEAQGGPIWRAVKWWSVLLLVWGPWPILGAWAQRQRGGSLALGAGVGLLFGPLGLLVANYSGGRKCPACRANVADRTATVCRSCRATLSSV